MLTLSTLVLILIVFDIYLSVCKDVYSRYTSAIYVEEPILDLNR